LALGTHEQAALSRWLDADGRQVVSATTHPLFPLIARGLFDEALYYRLNVMRLSIDSTGVLVREKADRRRAAVRGGTPA